MICYCNVHGKAVLRTSTLPFLRIKVTPTLPHKMLFCVSVQNNNKINNNVFFFFLVNLLKLDPFDHQARSSLQA